MNSPERSRGSKAIDKNYKEGNGYYSQNNNQGQMVPQACNGKESPDLSKVSQVNEL
jgi:hypothetical protein